VLNQKSVTVEVLVIDDSPERSAREVVDDLRDARVTYLANPNPTGGVPYLGWPLATGTFIHFLDDDDTIRQEWQQE
jgi:hypothetical protein